MKIANLLGPRNLVIEDWPLDTSKLGPNDLWGETEISGFKIGTDRGNYEGAEDVPGAPTYPRWVGDSNLAVIKGVGSAVTRFKVGDRVVSRQPHQSEWVTDQHGAIVKVPEGVDSEDAIWAHLYTLSGLCYRKANFVPGEYVAVVGLGVLGLGAIGLGPGMGARTIGIGNSPLRNEMAMKMGAHATFLYDDPDLQAKLDEYTNGNGIDLVILTANPWPAYRTSVEIVRDNGRVAIVSLLGRGEEPADFNPLAMKYFYHKSISLIAVNGTAPYQYPQSNADRLSWNKQCEFVLQLMADGSLKPSQIITHRLHYSRMKEAYEMAYNREKTMLGVTFQWTD
jgi:threonine dehydrogenase-like Zn-dependent dehydrogenase